MDLATRQQATELYHQGHTIREVATLLGNYKRESVREALHLEHANLRGRGVKYKPPKEMTDHEKEQFAELLGYMYGDGDISKCKVGKSEEYNCRITFATNEIDLVQRVATITQNLFGFVPTHQKGIGCVTLRLRRSLGRYFYSFGYPVGKKSLLNPLLPLHFLHTNRMKIAFLRGFLNAEASVNKTVFIHQSTRISLAEREVTLLQHKDYKVVLNGNSCYFIPWKKALPLIGQPSRTPNILTGVQLLLKTLQIHSRIYPIRLYIGHKGVTSIHFELRIPGQYIKRVAELQLLTCVKKQQKLKSILRE